MGSGAVFGRCYARNLRSVPRSYLATSTLHLGNGNFKRPLSNARFRERSIYRPCWRIVDRSVIGHRGVDGVPGQREPVHEFRRRHDDRSGAVPVATLQLQHELAGAVTLEPFVGRWRAGDIAAQPFEFLTLLGATADPRAQAEAVQVDARGKWVNFWSAARSVRFQTTNEAHLLRSALTYLETLRLCNGP
jgi:hypothetical protein